MTRRLSLLLVAALALGLAAAPARAGTYTVSGTCGLWSPFNSNGARVAVFADSGCTLIARNTFGAFSTAQGTAGGWQMSAPAGATIHAFSVLARLKGTSGWDAALFDSSGLMHAVCPGGVNCQNTNATELNYSYGPLAAGTTQVTARVRCYASSCTNTTDSAASPERGRFVISASTMTVEDTSPPNVRIAGGSAASPGWKRGVQQLTVDASDNVGIREYRAAIDGAAVGVSPRPDCGDVGRVVPCPNGTGTVDVQLAGIPDGTHTLSGLAVDSAGNAAGASQPIGVDNTPPVAPQGAEVVDGAGWRTTNRMSVRWSNPVERFAPIARALYELCPASAHSSDPAVAGAGRKRCVTGSRDGTDLHEISDLTVPSEGMWMLRRLWLQDAAGNDNPASAVTVTGLGFDATPPTGVAFADEEPNDPTRLNVRAGDDASGIAGGAIEARREGEDVWRPLATSVTGQGLTAVIDDEVLPRGVYDLRAVAINGAGLQQGSDRRVDGLPARIKLPVRERSLLRTGRYVGRSCHQVSRGGRVCALRLDASPRVRVGHATVLTGRLTLGRAPLGRRTLLVSRQLLGQQGWTALHSIRTARDGGFRYRATRGPARTLRFRYPGSPTIRGVNSNVVLRVPASSTISASRHLVITGEYVTFRGRLRGGWIPADGALVELQVYTRGAWRTFAQPRARRSGRWLYRYRFETIRGRASFRFRARIRRQADYPFTTGLSRPTRVAVRGL